MTAPYGAAYVRILADASGFEKDLKKQIQAAVDEVGKGTRFQEFGKAAKRAGEDAGEKVAEGTEDGLRRHEPQMRKEGERAGNAFGGGMLARMRAVLLSRGGLIAAVAPLAAGVLGQASGAVPAILASLPSLALAAAAGIGTLVAALHGFGAAVGAGVSGDTEAFNEALGKLAPSAQKVAREIVGLTGVFSDLQRDIQQSFFAQLEGSFARLAHNILPTLRATLPGLAGEFGKLFSSFLSGLGSKDSVSAIGTVLSELSRGLEPWIPLMGQLASSFSQVAAAAAPFIAALSGQAASALSGFLVSLNDSLGDGGIERFFGAAGEFFASLGGAVGPVLGLLGDILKAFSQLGSPTLAIIGQLANVLRQVLEPILPFLAEAAGALVEGLGKNLAALTPGLIALGKALGTFLGAVADELPALFDALVPLFENISQFLVAAGPSFGELLATLAHTLLPAMVQVLVDLLPLWEGMLPVWLKIATDVLPAMVPLLQAWLDILLAFMPFLPDLVNLFLAFVPTLLALVDVLVPLIKLWTDLLVILTPFISAVFQILGWVLKLDAAWVSLATNSTLIPFLKGVAKVLDEIASKVQKALDLFDLLPGGKKSKLDSKGNPVGGADGPYSSGAGGKGSKGAGGIAAYALGGKVTSPTLAMVGEQAPGIPEAIVPMGSPQQARQVARRTGLLQLLGSAGGGRGDVTVTVYLGTQQITDIIDVVVDDKLDQASDDLNTGTRGWGS